MEYLSKTINKYSSEFSKENIIKDKFKTISNHLDHLNKIDLFNDRKLEACPHCGNKGFIKNGKFKGIQRYKCKYSKCSKTFSAKTNSPFSYSKKSITLWMKYISLMNNGMTIRDCADILNINIATSFYWRHKILVAKSSISNSKLLKDYVEVNKIILKENFKGNRNAKNLDKQPIFIVCAMDNNNSIFSRAISRFSISLASISKNFYPNVDKSSFVVPFGDRCLTAFAKKHNSELSLTDSKTIKNINNINTSYNMTNVNIPNSIYRAKTIFINGFSFNIYRWLKRFRGVATKYLENYLSWHILDFKLNYYLNEYNQIDLIKNLNLENSYIQIKNLKNFMLSYQYTSDGNC